MSTGSETSLMLEQPAQTKLYSAMHRARAAMKVVGKSGFNKFDSYQYATLADYLESIQKPLDEHGLIVVSDIDNIKWLDDRITSNGKSEKVCQIMLRTTVIHAESGESLSVIVLGEGQDRGDKAFYKADTGARKYALANLFNLATDEDPETDSPQNEKPTGPKSAPSAPAKGTPKPATPAAEKPKKLDVRKWTTENILKLLEAADGYEHLAMVIDGAVGGDSWADPTRRDYLLAGTRERYIQLIDKKLPDVPAITKPFLERMKGYREALDAELAVLANSKQALDGGFEALQQKLEAESTPPAPGEPATETTTNEG